MLYEEISSKVIKCCFDVMNELGVGFLENVYQNALMIALNEKGIKAIAQYPLKVYFREKIVGNYIADIFVEDKIIIELKAVSTLLPEHSAQVINYLKASNIEIGLLINFGNGKIDFKRLYNNE